MTGESNGVWARVALAGASAAVAVAVMAIIIAGVSVSDGQTLEVGQGDEPLQFSLDGGYVNVTGSIQITSHLHDTIDDVSLEVWAVGSSEVDDDSALLFSIDSLSVPGNGSTQVTISSQVSLSAMYFVVEDFLLSALNDSNPQVTVQIKADAGYMRGLLTAQVDGVFTVSLAEIGSQIGYVVDYDDPSRFYAEITGLASWLVPDYGSNSYTIACDGGYITVAFGTMGDANGMYVEVTSGQDLVSAILTIVSSDAITITDGDGNSFDAVAENISLILRTFNEILDELGGGSE